MKLLAFVFKEKQTFHFLLLRTLCLCLNLGEIPSWILKNESIQQCHTKTNGNVLCQTCFDEQVNK